jgi:hypothetical protein
MRELADLHLLIAAFANLGRAGNALLNFAVLLLLGSRPGWKLVRGPRSTFPS